MNTGYCIHLLQFNTIQLTHLLLMNSNFYFSFIYFFKAPAVVAAPTAPLKASAFLAVLTLKLIPTLIHSKKTTASWTSMPNFEANCADVTLSAPPDSNSLISLDFCSVCNLYFSIIRSKAFLCNSHCPT
mmetsp:Transcript_58612/g.65584  ORF Transcript_58612/g.65584 Transcript_58612/m.65584 type:complete len:129 (-) Transcript_58612:346-732(-)